MSAAYIHVAEKSLVTTLSTVIPLAMIAAGVVILFVGRKKKLPVIDDEGHALVSDALTPAMSLYLVCAVAVHIFM